MVLKLYSSEISRLSVLWVISVIGAVHEHARTAKILKYTRALLERAPVPFLAVGGLPRCSSRGGKVTRDITRLCPPMLCSGTTLSVIRTFKSLLSGD